MNLQIIHRNRIMVFIFLAVVSFMIAIVSILNINKYIIEFENVKKIVKLSYQVRYYDEVLTMSARMATYQNSQFWKDRYYQNVEKLDSLIIQITEKMPLVKSKLDEVEKSNKKLIQLEEQALNKSLNQEYEEARKLLFSNEYNSLKKVYESSINETLILLEKNGKKLEEALNKNIFISSIITIFFIILIFILAYYIFKQLVFYNKNLENEVKKQVDALTKKDLVLVEQSKMASLGEMLENIAHQWKQPLSVISTSVSAIKFKKDFDELDDNTLDFTLDNIQNSTNHLSKTIDVFRDFYQNDTTKEFSIKSTFNKAKTLLSSKFKTKEILVLADFEDYKVTSRENELVQVIMNILSNAIDELQKVEDRKRIILVESSVEAEFIRLEIKDNAGGINKNIIEKIFEHRFTTKKNNKGTGIGLYMSRLIMEKSSGSIRAENTTFYYDDIPQKGANFILEIKK